MASYRCIAGSNGSKLYRLLIMMAIIVRYYTGAIITTQLGDNKTIQWTMNPVPQSSVVVTVLHPSENILFTVLGITVIPAVSDIGKRVSNTGNTNTTTGHIEFTLNDITVEDAGNYRTQFQPSGAIPVQEVGRFLVVYVVPSKPTITEEVEPFLGNIMVLNCSATSNSKPDSHVFDMKYTWYRDSSDLPSGGRYNASGQHLQVMNIEKSDDGAVFTCRAYEYASILSNSSDPYTTKVNYGPGTVSPDTLQELSLVENTVLGPITCSADCSPPCIYQWMYNGVNFSGPNDTLTINNIQRTSAGVYWCVATNVYGSERSKNIITIVLFGPISVTVTPDTRYYNLQENKNETLGPITCIADCFPKCSFQWSRDGGLIERTSSLTINNITRSASGIYVCRARNSVSDRQSVPLNVVVEYPPDTFMLEPSNPQYTLLENATLGPVTCSADCFPLCQFRWMHRSENITNTTFIKFEKIQRHQSGVYSCIAWNRHGSHSGDVSLTVIDSVQPPVQLRAECRSPETAELLFHVQKEVNASFEVQASTDGKFFMRFKSEFDFPGQQLVITRVYGLQAKTTYHFKVTSTSNFGSTESEKNLNCTTPGAETTQVCAQNHDGEATFHAGIAMIVVSLVVIVLSAVITVIMIRRYRPKKDPSSKNYKDTGTKEFEGATEQYDFCQEMEAKSTVYQDLGQKDVPTVYEQLKTRDDQGGNQGHYVNTGVQ